MIDRAFADRFASEWIARWNARDLDAILAHYTEDIVFHSPRIAVVMSEPLDFVSGKPGLRRYWAKALANSRDLHFDLERVYLGSDSVTIAYRNHRDVHIQRLPSGGAERRDICLTIRAPLAAGAGPGPKAPLSASPSPPSASPPSSTARRASRGDC